jgi:DNA-binding PadR family transcriptional regulator
MSYQDKQESVGVPESYLGETSPVAPQKDSWKDGVTQILDSHDSRLDSYESRLEDLTRVVKAFESKFVPKEQVSEVLKKVDELGLLFKLRSDDHRSLKEKLYEVTKYNDEFVRSHNELVRSYNDFVESQSQRSSSLPLALKDKVDVKKFDILTESANRNQRIFAARINLIAKALKLNVEDLTFDP